MLSLILKGTNACNLRCSYCSLGKKEQVRMLGQKEMRNALFWFLEYAKTRKQYKVSIILHGGEPFIVPAEQYRFCFQELREKYPGVEIRYSAQTNGYQLSEEHLKLIQDYKIRIGISLDGDKSIHDRQRRDVHGNPTYEKIMENIHILKKNAIPVSLLMVVTSYHQQMDFRFFDFLAKEKIPVKINPLYQSGEAKEHPDLAISGGGYGQFLIALFDYLIQHEVDLHVSPLEELLHAILYEDSPRGCNFCNSCLESFLCINQKGDIYPCGRFSDNELCKIGNISEGIWAEGNERIAEIRARRNEKLPLKCFRCKYLRLCHAGCSACSYQQDSENVPDGLCEDYYMVFEYLSGLGLMKYKKYLEDRKRKIQIILTGGKNEL